ncbi:hypothetical protein, partial [Selenihalanaerobacter shriftii]
MKKNQKNIILILTLVVIMLSFGVTVQAESKLKVNRMEVELKPEYDSSDMFTIYDTYLKNTSTEVYSGTVKFLVPKGAKIENVCEITGAGNHNCQLYDVKLKGDQKLITWEIGQLQPGEEYHAYLEYYYNPLEITGNSRVINFDYETTYNIKNFNFKVTEPLNASNYSANLNEARVQTDGYGLKNHFYQLVNLNEGENVNITVKYDRSNTGPSITRTNNQNTDAVASQQPVSNESNSNNSMLLILAIIIIGIMGYFIYNMI